ncbi:MAG: IS110 family transposase [Nitrosospira sp.]|nr:IS110 family transposase [Nitrosospira sp.]
MLTIACDVSKATVDAAWFDERRQRWFERSKVVNNRQGWRGMLKWLEKVSGKSRTEFVLMVEATGVYHRPLVDFACTEGLRVIVSNPGRAAENARSHNLLNKSDRLDARNLHGYAQELKKVHEYVPDTAEINNLNALLSRQRQLDRDLQREQNRLEKCPFIAASESLAASIRRQIKAIQHERNTIQGEIDQLIKSHTELSHLQRLLCSIKGIGKVSSQWLLPLLYRERFTSARQLAAFLGLTPIHKRSGTSLNKRGRLSGRGNRYVRSRLYMPAVSAISHDPAMRAFHDKLIRRGKTPKQAITAVMRKLVHVCYGVVKNDQPYRSAAAA